MAVGCDQQKMARNDEDRSQGAAARDAEKEIKDSARSAKKQIEGIRSVRVGPVVRRLPMTARERPAGGARTQSMLAFGRGVEIVLEVDELAFEGGSAFLLGSVLNHYFSRYVSINSFTETALRTLGRGEINRWVPQWGARPTL